MRTYWKYVLVALVAFLVGSAAFVSAQGFGHFVNATGKVVVKNFPEVQRVSGTVGIGNFPATQDVAVKNFPPVQAVGVVKPVLPKPSTIVNIVAHELAGISLRDPIGPPPCLEESTYIVPDGKTLLITDVNQLGPRVGNPTALATDARGIFWYAGTNAFIQFATPLVVEAGETVCPFRVDGGPEPKLQPFFISGQLVDAE